MTGHVTLAAQYVTDVFYIFNSTVVDWTCLFVFFPGVGNLCTRLLLSNHRTYHGEQRITTE